MEKLKALNKKGNATVIGTIITIVLLFVLFLIITMFAKTQADMKDGMGDTTSTNVVNESHPQASLVYNQAFPLDNNINDSYFKDVSSILVTNGTLDVAGSAGIVIDSGNYTVDAKRGYITPINDSTTGTYDWNISYTFTVYDKEGAQKINIESLVGMTDAAKDNPSSMYLIAIVIMIIVLVMMLVAVVQRMRG